MKIQPSHELRSERANERAKRASLVRCERASDLTSGFAWSMVSAEAGFVLNDTGLIENVKGSGKNDLSWHTVCTCDMI